MKMEEYVIPNVRLELVSDVLGRDNFKLFEVCDACSATKVLRRDWAGINIYESVYVLMLNAANQVVGKEMISKGGIRSVVVDVSIVMKLALLSNASAVILAHNHPSGSLKASKEDMAITDKLKTALGYADIKLLDHIIVTNNSYYSFADNGEI